MLRPIRESNVGLTINLVFDAQALAASASFRAAVQTAAAMWDAAIATPITVNLMVGYGEFRGGALGDQAGAEGGLIHPRKVWPRSMVRQSRRQGNSPKYWRIER